MVGEVNFEIMEESIESSYILILIDMSSFNLKPNEFQYKGFKTIILNN